jgi:hypothetical protein
MSMPNPFGSPQAAAPAAPVVAAPEPPSPGRRKAIVMAAAGVGALGVAAGAYLLLFSGSGSAADLAGPVAKGTPKVSATAPTSPTAAPTTIPTVSGAKARNPFVPLVVEQAAASTGATTAPALSSPTPSASAITTVPTPSATTPSVQATPAGPGTPSASSTARTVAPVTLTLSAVATSNAYARYTVDTQPYQVKPGQAFAKYFKLVSLASGKCSVVQYGDTTFPLCDGQSKTLK